MLSVPEPSPIYEVARKLGIDDDCVLPFGHDKAKIRLDALARSSRPPGKLILVSAITPTPAGEGKTTMAIALADGLQCIGEKACLALREPSLGPVFGQKGGATGGGRCRLVPSTDIELHFTGDFHAVSSAHNLLAALLDNHLHHDLKPRIDPRRVHWRRVIDMNDRALRQIVSGLGGVTNGVPCQSGFDITAASEIMAALCLADDAKSMRARLDRIIVADAIDGRPITVADLAAGGPMMALLNQAMLPNLVQTAEGVPALVHGGPFANIAHGCNSVIATRMAMAHADWAITEAGFGFALGAEKFFDIKCVSARLDTAAVVLVATLRALRHHGGGKADIADSGAVKTGLDNLFKHIESIREFGEVPVVALNRFPDDTEQEIAVVRDACATSDVPFAVCDSFARGGDGATELATAVTEHAERTSKPFRPLYDWSASVEDKMLAIAQKMYGARAVNYTKKARNDLARITANGYAGLPLCVAKTPASLSDDPRRSGRPRDFDVTVREILLAAGAGYLVPLLGEIVRMPGLPRRPRALDIDVVDSRVIGLESS